MSFFGLPALATLGLALGVGAIVLALYSVRWRMPQQRVSTTALWQGVLARGRGAGRLGTLEHLMSLLLQLAIGAALVLAAGQPRFGCQSQAGRAVVLVLDASASMGTVERVETRLEIARRRVLSRVELSAGSDELALVLAGGVPTIAVPLGHPSAELRRAISAVGLRYGPGSLTEAVRRGCSLLGGRAGSLVVFTDGFEDLGECAGADLEVVTIGEKRPNIGITAFSADVAPHDPSHGVAFLQVANAWRTPVTAELRLVLDGKLLEVWPIDVQPGQSVHRSFDGLPILEPGLLEARITQIHFEDDRKDALKEDDRAFTVLARRPKIPIDLIGTSEALRLVLQSNPRYAVTRRRGLSDAVAAIKVVVGAVPGPLGEGRYLLIDPSGEALPFSVGATTKEPKITRWNDRHPILRRVVLSDLYLGEATTLTLPPAATALVSSPSTPLMFALDDGKRRVVGFGFSVEQSNLPLRVGFPVLIYNAVDWLLDARQAEDAPGQFRSDSAVRVVTPSNRILLVEPVEGKVTVPEDEVGFYRVSARDGRTLGSVAVSVNSESETLSGAQRPSAKGAVGGRARDREPWVAFLALAFALLLVEWLTFQRRMTV